jgi:hypothetical protein
MYFAAEARLRQETKVSDRISIWALELIHFQNWYHRQAVEQLHVLPRKILEVVTAPRAGNANLHAQSGVFTLFNRGDYQASAKVDRRPLDVMLQDYSHELITPNFNHSVFHHFTLPASESHSLLLLLEQREITPARLFPGFDGVAKDVEHSAKLRSSWEMDI